MRYDRIFLSFLQLLLRFLGQVSVKLFPSNLLFSLAGNGLDGLLNLVLSEVKFKHIGYFLQVVKSNPLLSFPIDQSKRLPPALLSIPVTLDIKSSTIASVSIVKNC